MEKSEEFVQDKEDDHDDGRNDVSSGNTRSPVKRTDSNQSHLVIIRDDPTIGNKKSWKHFRDKFKLHRSGSGGGASWTSSVHIPASDVPIQQGGGSGGKRMFSRRDSTRYPTSSSDDPNPTTESSQPEMFPNKSADQNRVTFASLPRTTSRTSTLRRTTSTAPHRVLTPCAGNISELSDRAQAGEEEDEEEEEEEEDEEGGEKMSLMALLADGDNDGLSSFMMDGDDDEDEEEESGRGEEEHTCCMCMVRHKGSTFIACGHTFCRLCSRELWVQKGNCPLCNGFISEILEIF